MDPELGARGEEHPPPNLRAAGIAGSVGVLVGVAVDVLARLMAQAEHNERGLSRVLDVDQMQPLALIPIVLGAGVAAFLGLYRSVGAGVFVLWFAFVPYAYFARVAEGLRLSALDHPHEPGIGLWPTVAWVLSLLAVLFGSAVGLWFLWKRRPRPPEPED